jgi:hypothetical protein
MVTAGFRLIEEILRDVTAWLLLLMEIVGLILGLMSDGSRPACCAYLCSLLLSSELGRLNLLPLLFISK